MAQTVIASKASSFLSIIEGALLPLANESLSLVEQAGLIALQGLFNRIAAKIPPPPTV